MSEDSYEDQEPPKKVPRTEPAGQSGQQCFGTLKSNTEMIEICKGFVLDKTKSNTEWAIHIFCEWRSYRNKATTVVEEMCPVDLLEHPKTSLLNYWLSRFVMEAGRVDGKPYTLPLLYQTCWLVCTDTVKAVTGTAQTL